jgi:predicted nucleic acid-binding protein
VIPAGLYVVDTSAIARIRHDEIRVVLTRLGRLGLLATCVTVDLEVLYSARNLPEYESTSQLRSTGFTELPLTAAIGDRARAVQAALARQGKHRAAGVVDLLTAAVAEHYAATVLHYDSDFDHIAAVTRQSAEWVVPRGSAG